MTGLLLFFHVSCSLDRPWPRMLTPRLHLSPLHIFRRVCDRGLTDLSPELFTLHFLFRFGPSWDKRVLVLTFVSAAPLCMARWSVLSLLIKYCGSSFEARTV